MKKNDKKDKQPLRSSVNKMKDIFNTYKKNENEPEIKFKEEDTEMIEEELNDLEEQEVEIEEESDEFEKIRIERDELKEKLLRSIAESENILRRTAKEKQDLVAYANEKLLSKMLEILDDMDNALAAAQKSDDKDVLLNGIEMIRSKMGKIFEENGVKQMDDSVGEEFNVDLHEALMTMPHEEIEEGKVVQVVQKGYNYHERVLRHAKVITSSGKA